MWDHIRPYGKVLIICVQVSLINTEEMSYKPKQYSNTLLR